MGAAGKRVRFRSSARMGTIAASLAAAATLLLPNAALAAPTEIGSALGTIPCANPGDYVQASSSGSTYVVPPGATSISSWSIQAVDGETGPVELEVWQSTSVPLTYELVGISPPTTLTPGGVNTNAVDIPVAPGDLLGLRLEVPFTCAQAGTDADSIGSHFGDPTALTGTALMTIFTGAQLNVAATLEVTVNPPPPPPTPTTADQCKHGGWQGLKDTHGTLFKNQGDCVSFVATQGTNLAAGSST